MDRSLSHFELADDASSKGTSSNSDPGSIDIVSYSNGDHSTNDGDNEASDNNVGIEIEEDFDDNLPETVTLLRHPKTGAKVYLVGTSHFSRESQEDVAKVIRNVIPHIVVLELCPSRTYISTLDEETIMAEAKDINMKKIMSSIMSSGVYYGLMHILLLNMSASITKEIGLAPGGEFRTAFREVKQLQNCELVLGDRPLQITLKRALSNLSWFQSVKLAWQLLTSNDIYRPQDIEKCKQRAMLEELLAELTGEFPSLSRVFIDERDIYLTHRLQEAALKPPPSNTREELNTVARVVGIIGMGHVAGITKLWPMPQDSYIADIMTIPPPSRTSKLIKILYKMSVLTLGGYIVYRFLPMPKLWRENIHLFVSKIAANINTGNGIMFTLF